MGIAFLHLDVGVGLMNVRKTRNLLSIFAAVAIAGSVHGQQFEV